MLDWDKKLNCTSKDDNRNQRNNLNSSAIMETYFRDLTDEEIRRLFKIYENDFRLFGYSYRRGNLILP